MATTTPKHRTTNIRMGQHETLRRLADIHRTSVRALIDALAEHFQSLPVEQQSALIRGEMNGKPARSAAA